MPPQFSEPFNDIVTLLLRRGANPNWVTKNCSRSLLPFSTGYSGNDTLFPLMSAACGNTDVPVKLLLRAGANINQTNSVGQTALHGRCHTAYGDYTNNILKTLLSHSADVHMKDVFGRTPLHYACQHAKLEVVNCLLEAGAQFNIVDGSGFTELELAAQSYNDPDLKVSRLMESYSFPNQMIIEVHETLAWYLARNSGSEGGTSASSSLQASVDCMRKATSMRKEHNCPKIVPQPLECYDFTKEWEAMEDLELHCNSPEELEMQAILARERIYKGKHTIKLLKDNLDFQCMYMKTYTTL